MDARIPRSLKHAATHPPTHTASAGKAKEANKKKLFLLINPAIANNNQYQRDFYSSATQRSVLVRVLIARASM